MIKVPSTLSASSVVSWCVPSKKREFSANGSLPVSVFHSQPHISAVCPFTNPRSHIQSLGRVCSLEVPGPTRYKGSLGTHCALVQRGAVGSGCRQWRVLQALMNLRETKLTGTHTLEIYKRLVRKYKVDGSGCQ